MRDGYCRNHEKHSTGLETLTECQGLCLERDNCTGVSYISYKILGKNDCDLCRDNNTETRLTYNTFMKPGNSELIVFKNMLGVCIS